jgi:hypothetical protein
MLLVLFQFRHWIDRVAPPTLAAGHLRSAPRCSAADSAMLFLKSATNLKMKLTPHSFHSARRRSAATIEAPKHPAHPIQCAPQRILERSPQQPMPSKMSIIATSKLRREMPKPRQILSKPSVAAAAAPIMTHPKTHLIQPDESPNAGSACGTIIDMPTTNTITQPAIDSVAAILILSFHHARTRRSSIGSSRMCKFNPLLQTTQQRRAGSWTLVAVDGSPLSGKELSRERCRTVKDARSIFDRGFELAAFVPLVP